MAAISKRIAFLVFGAALMGALSVSLTYAFVPPKGAGDATGGVATDDVLAEADLERGKSVFQRSNCVSCHGWDGNGMGKSPRSEGNPALLRDSQLDAATMIEIIRCGIPGTPMPYHNSRAYKDPEICYGMTMADFEAGKGPHPGKFIREPDLINLVAYLMESVVGAGETTLEQCETYFKPGDRACEPLR